MEKKMSITEVSELAGVSTSTVSRIINHRGKYSRETEEKVKAIIADHQYVPNASAKALRMNSVPTVGVICPDLMNEYFMEITLRLQKYFFDAGYSTIVCNTYETQEILTKHIQHLKSQNVGGIVYLFCMLGETEIPHEIPSVFIGEFPAENEVIWPHAAVLPDIFTAGRLATEALLKRGCRRIVYFKNSRETNAVPERYRGYLQALSDSGIAPDESLVKLIDTASGRATYEAVTKLITENVSFDGLFCCSDISATGAMRALKEHHIDVPGAVKLISFENTRITKYYSPAISSIDQFPEELGRIAAENMLKLIAKEQLEQPVLCLPVQLIVRETT